MLNVLGSLLDGAITWKDCPKSKNYKGAGNYS